MSRFLKFFPKIFRTFTLVTLSLLYATVLFYTVSIVPSTAATLGVFSAPSNFINESSSTALKEYRPNIKSNKSVARQPTDTYLMTNQRDCFKSRTLFACVKYRAAKFVWSLATNQYNYFDSSNSNSYIDVSQGDNNQNDDIDDENDDGDGDSDNDDDYVENNKSISNRRNFSNVTAAVDRKNFQMKFVYLNSPSDLELFEETRTFQGDGEISKAVKFVKRAVQTFFQNHGLQVSLNSLGGFQVSRGGKNYITGELERQYYSDYLYRRHKRRGHHKNMKKRLKFAILLPIIILLKLFHLKLTVIPLLFFMNSLNILLIAGGTYILYYLKHHTVCKIKPHLSETHSHVWDSLPPDYSSFAYPHGAEVSGPYGLTSKDWASSKAYNAYNYLDTISRPI